MILAKRFPRAVAALWLLAMSGCRQEAVVSPATFDASPGPTHVVIISIDTQRADWFGCYGHPWVATPNIDRFAEDSILFESALTPIPETLPAHVSLLTGHYPHTHGVPRNGHFVNSENVMLAERLKNAGYATAGFVSSFTLSDFMNFGQGFDEFGEDFDEPDGPDEGMDDILTRPGWFTGDRAAEYLSQVDASQPQFLFVHYWDPHLPYIAPPEYEEPYRGYPFDPDSVTDHRRFPNGEDYIPPEFRGDEMREGLRGYAAEVTYVDAHVGALLDTLRASGIYDDALILLTADHGETLWDHVPYFHHSMTLFDSTLHVPAIVKLPRSLHAGTRISTNVSTVDWVPTLLSYLGIPSSEDFDGRDLRLKDGGQGLETVPIFSEGTRPYNATDKDAEWLNAAMAKRVTFGTHTLIVRPYLDAVAAGEVNPIPLEPVAPPRAEEALFHREDDPGELNNLLSTDEVPADLAGTVVELRTILDAFVASADPLPSMPAEIGIPREELDEKLKALGYAQ